MLNENIKSYRKKNGLSQEDLAAKLNVVRQTVSKWETGLSVPDAEMLIKLAEVLNTSVNSLLGETEGSVPEEVSLSELSQKLELLTVQFADHNEKHRKRTRITLVILLVITLFLLIQSVIVLCAASVTVDVSSTNVYFAEPSDEITPSLGIIGGADGPTAILIATTGFPWFELFLSVLFLVASVLLIIGIVKTKRKK